MKLLVSLFLSMLFLHISYAQESLEKSDLRVMIDSVILHQIGYTIDNTTSNIPTSKRDAIQQTTPIRSISSIATNTMPLILMNKQRISKAALNHYQLADISSINVFKKNNSIAMSIYGTSAKNGLIVLTTKK